MKNKRLLLANSLLRFGGGLINRWANREHFFVFNYHRVSASEKPVDTAFDEGVFGHSQAQLKQQLEFLQKHTTILSEQDLIKALFGDLSEKGPYSMVTFDDAYIDNYQLAMPILAKLGVPAIFFVPALIIENRNLGWWDQIAYIIKKSQKAEIDFRGEKLVLKNRKPAVINKLIEVMKMVPHEQTSNLVTELAEKTDWPTPSKEIMDKELMNWDQLREAYEAGVALGSHTCSHRVLATLNETEQADEIIKSKSIIEKKLNIKVRSLAFPVGGLEHFNKITLKHVEKAGYDMAFSFNTGVTKFGAFNRFAIPRLGAPSDFKSFNALFHFPNLMDYNATRRRKFQKASELD
jgi:peptidoglycan/xylan/chitin deacetylase (PgdA/CDA1 family)